MQPWATSRLGCGRHRPRQFEYHPLLADMMVFGTVRGEAVVMDTAADKVIKTFSSGLGKSKHDSILGLCWLKTRPNRFAIGSSQGYVRVCDVESGGEDVICKFDDFEKLTSVHVNSTDQHILASGYSSGVRLYDIEAGSVLRDFAGIHQDHINISRFANHSPFLFATSSFDRTVKTWDSRARDNKRPIYTCTSLQGNVMVCFSPDDTFLLTSAIDNEVAQYFAVDGQLHTRLEMPRTGLTDSFTRAYYTSSGRLILSGSSEEQVVRLHCAQTGRMINAAEMYAGRKNDELFIQSLRGDPANDFRFSVLVNYRHEYSDSGGLEIIHADMLRGRDGEDLSPVTRYTSSTRLAADLGRACMDKDHADVVLVAPGGSYFLAHKAVLACRSAVLCRQLNASSAALSADRGTGAVANAAAAAAPAAVAAAAALPLKPAPRRCRSLGGQDMRLNVSYMDGSVAAVVGDAAGAGTRAPLAMVHLPAAVHPSLVPVVLEFLYTDQLNLHSEVSPDGFLSRAAAAAHAAGSGLPGDPPAQMSSLGALGAGASAGEAQARWLDSWDSAGRQAKLLVAGGAAGGGEIVRKGSNSSAQSVAEAVSALAGEHDILVTYERLLQAAAALELRRLFTLVEWECRQRVCNETVVFLVLAARRRGAAQLERYCLQYLVPHLESVLALHKNAQPLPQEVLHGVEVLRRQRMFINVPDRAASPSNADADGAAAMSDAAGDGGGGGGGGGGGAAGEETEEEDDVLALADDEESSTSSAGSGDDSALAHGEAALPLVTGHTAEVVGWGGMLVVGGANKRQFHSCRHLLSFDPDKSTWSKQVARGRAPQSLIYHSAVVVEDRTLVVYGGSSQNGNEEAEPLLWALDTHSMTWSCPKAEGPGPPARTRHTMVAFEPQKKSGVLFDAAAVASRKGAAGAPAAAVVVGPAAGVAVSSGGSSGGSGGSGSYYVRDPRDLYLRDVSEDPYLVGFGGYSLGTREAFSDVFVLNVSKVPTGEQPHPPTPSSARESSGGCGGSSGGSGGGVRSSYGAAACRHRFLWLQTSVAGTPPPPRLAHAAAALPLSESQGGNIMVVFGGVGLGAVFDDTHVLRCPSAGSLRWEDAEPAGRQPSKRYGHSMVAVRGTHSLVVFGGTSGRQALNDMHVLRVQAAQGGALSFSWTEIKTWGPRPCPRSRHTMCEDKQGRLLVFGGSDEVPARGPSETPKSREVDTDVYVIQPSFANGTASRRRRHAASESDGEGRMSVGSGESDHEEEEESGFLEDPGIPTMHWRWVKPIAQAFDPGYEPPVIVEAATLHSDMMALAETGMHADIEFRFQTPSANFATTPSNTAHYAFLSPPTTFHGPAAVAAAAAAAATPGAGPATAAGHLNSRPGPSPALSPWSSAAGFFVGSPCHAWRPASHLAAGGASRTPPVGSPQQQQGAAAAARAGGLGFAAAAAAQGGAERGRGLALPPSRLSNGSHRSSDPMQMSPPISPASMSESWASACSSLPTNRSRPNHQNNGSYVGDVASSAASGAISTADSPTAAAAAAAALSGGPGSLAAAALSARLSARGGGQSAARAFFASSPVAKKLPAHRLVLSLRSPPLRAMLQSGMRESFSDCITIKDIRDSVFRTLLGYLYTDTLQLESPDDIMELLVAANQYTLDDLVALCEGFLQGVMDPENAASLYHYADALHLPHLKHRALAFILRSFEAVRHSDGYLRLPPEVTAEIDEKRMGSAHAYMLDQPEHPSVAGGRLAEWVYEGDESDSPGRKNGQSSGGDNMWRVAWRAGHAKRPSPAPGR